MILTVIDFHQSSISSILGVHVTSLAPMLVEYMKHSSFKFSCYINHDGGYFIFIPFYISRGFEVTWLCSSAVQRANDLYFIKTKHHTIFPLDFVWTEIKAIKLRFVPLRSSFFSLLQNIASQLTNVLIINTQVGRHFLEEWK